MILNLPDFPIELDEETKQALRRLRDNLLAVAHAVPSDLLSGVVLDWEKRTPTMGVDMAETGADETVVSVSEELRQAAEWMIWELEDCSLDVSLAEAPEKRHAGHKIRVVDGRNPGWYRDLCADYPSTRRIRRGKFDTLIRRRSVLRALEEIKNGRCSTIYAKRLLPYVEAQAKREPESFWRSIFE